MAVQKPNLTVQIFEEEYRLDMVPSAESKVVASVKKDLIGEVDLHTLVNDLGRVGAFIRIAYNGIGAAGPKFTELQIEVQGLGYDVTKLCDQSALTVSKFKKACSTVLADLEATYGYLLDNLEDLALETLSSVSKIAGDMKIAAQDLQIAFEKEKEKVVSALEKTQKARSQEQRIKEDKEREREQINEDLMLQKKLMEDAKKLEKEAEAQRQRMEMNEDDAINSIQHTSGIKKIINAVLGAEIFDDGTAAQERVEHWKEKRIEALEKEKEFRKMRYEALERMTKFAAKIKECTTAENMAEAATYALHESISALKQLSVVMMQAAQFWAKIQDHCKSLAEDRFKNVVEKAISEYSETKRLKVWTSMSFKKKAVLFYAEWVALSSVCVEYVERIKETQRDLYEYIKENPTFEQCRVNVHKLAETFLSDLKEDQKEITSKELKAGEEIKALKN